MLSYVEYPTFTCTSADVYRICRISFMYMYRAAVHSLDAEFTVLEMSTSNAVFLCELKILYHFIHASILPTYRTRLTFSALVASCVFDFSLEPGANFINKVRTMYLKLCVRCFLRSAYVSFITTS